MRGVGVLGMVLVLAAGCGGPLPCDAATDHVAQCGGAGMAERFAATCDDEEAAQVLAAECTTLAAALDAKADGSPIFKEWGAGCTFAFQCAANLTCLRDSAGQKRCLFGPAAFPAGDSCLDTSECRAGLACRYEARPSPTGGTFSGRMCMSPSARLYGEPCSATSECAPRLLCGHDFATNQDGVCTVAYSG